MIAAASKRAMAPVGVFTLLLACRNTEMNRPVSPEQQTSAVHEARKFREAFNQGACEAVYLEAAGSFRRQSKQDWMKQCAELHQRLGLWRGSDIRSAVMCGPQLICLDGTAAFETGSYDLELAWMFHKGRPRLCWWVVEGRGQTMRIPPAIPRNLMDPPLRNRSAQPA